MPDHQADRSPHRKNVLIVTAVAAEKEAVERGVRRAASYRRPSAAFHVIAAGVGPAHAAAATAAALSKDRYDIVISAGIAGGFPGRASVGSIAIADELIAADLGAETAEGFRTLEDLELGVSRIRAAPDEARRLRQCLHDAGLPAVIGPILTVSTATGTKETFLARQALVPQAAAEAMEGFGAAVAARWFGLPVLEVRTISNEVGPRNRAAWRIGEALAALEKVSSCLPEVFD